MSIILPASCHLMCIHKISQGKVVGYYIAVDNCSTTKKNVDYYSGRRLQQNSKKKIKNNGRNLT